MDIKKEGFITNSFEETQKIGKEFITMLHLDKGVTLPLPKKGAFAVALYGDLGSGKTTFVQGLAKGLGIKKRIVSPTFIIVRSYRVSIKYKVLSIKYLYHIDLYRVESEKDIGNLGIGEILSDSRNVVVIEWAERMRSFLPKKRTDIKFSYIDREKRKIEVCAPRIPAP